MNKYFLSIDPCCVGCLRRTRKNLINMRYYIYHPIDLGKENILLKGSLMARVRCVFLLSLCGRVYNCHTPVLGHFLLSLCVPECTIVRHQSWDASFCPSVCQSVQWSQTSLRARPQDSLLPEEDVKKPKKQAKPSSILMSCNQYPSFHNFQVLKSTWQSVFCVIVK